MVYLFILVSIQGFLRTIGIIVLIYYGIKIISRFLFPIVVKKAMNNMQERQNMYQREQKREGEVTIENKNPRSSRNSANKGEYVDFEEIE